MGEPTRTVNGNCPVTIAGVNIVAKCSCDFEIDAYEPINPKLANVAARGKITIYIDYPLRGNFEFVRSRKEWTFLDIAAEVQKIYKNIIYMDEEKYGVWGHGIDDLRLEMIYVNSGAVTLDIGS